MPPDGWETDCLAAVGCGPSDRCLSRSGWKWLFFYGSFLPPLPLSLSFLNGFSVLGRRRRWQRESVRRVANTTIVSCGGRARPRRRRLAGCPPGCVHHSPGRGRCLCRAERGVMHHFNAPLSQNAVMRFAPFRGHRAEWMRPFHPLG